MRFNQIVETTTAGSVATLATPMMTQARESANVSGLKPVQAMNSKSKKKGPYANSISEGKVKELHKDLKDLTTQQFQEKYKQSKSEVRDDMKKVNEDELSEQDLIIIPGQGRLRRTGFVKHNLDQGEHEGHTLKNSLHTIARAATDLDKRLSVQSEFPEWVSEKIGAAKSMMVSVMDYLISSQEMQHDPEDMSEAYGPNNRRDAYQRDYDHSVAGMDRPNNHRDDERHDLDPSDWYKKMGTKMYTASIYPRQIAQAEKEGWHPTKEQARANASSEGVAEGVVDTIKKVGKALVKPVKDPILNQMKDISNAAHKRAINAQNTKYAPKGVAEGSNDHRALGRHHEEMADQELRKVGSKLPDSWDAAKLRNKLASHPKYAQALKHLDKSEYHFGKAAKQGVAEGEEDPQSELKLINQKLKDAYKQVRNNSSVSIGWYMSEVKALKDRREELIKQLRQGVAEGSKMARHNILAYNILAKAPKPKNQQEYNAIEKYKADLAKSYQPEKEQGVAEGSNDHRALGRHHEEMADQELRKVGSKLPDSWDAAKLRNKLASHPKYAQALKHLDKSEYHFGKAAKQGVAEGEEDPQSELKLINQKLKDAYKQVRNNSSVSIGWYMSQVKALKARREELIKQLRQGVAEGSTTRGGFGGSASQAPHEIQWLKNKIETLKPLLAKKPSVARQIKDLERQIRERELAIAYQKEGVAEANDYFRRREREEGRIAGTIPAKKAVVKTNKPIGSRVADIGAGGKEYNVKTDAAWDAAQKKVAESYSKKK